MEAEKMKHSSEVDVQIQQEKEVGRACQP